MIQITIPGKPIAKKRPRFYRRGKFVGTYNDQETEEGKWMWEAKQQIPGEPLVGPIQIEIIFKMPVTKAWSKRQLKSLSEYNHNVWHIKKPDLDNLVKFCKDCLTGLAWKDDSQVSFIGAKKIYGLKSETIIRISSL